MNALEAVSFDDYIRTMDPLTRSPMKAPRLGIYGTLIAWLVSGVVSFVITYIGCSFMSSMYRGVWPPFSMILLGPMYYIDGLPLATWLYNVRDTPRKECKKDKETCIDSAQWVVDEARKNNPGASEEYLRQLLKDKVDACDATYDECISADAPVDCSTSYLRCVSETGNETDCAALQVHCLLTE